METLHRSFVLNKLYGKKIGQSFFLLVSLVIHLSMLFAAGVIFPERDSVSKRQVRYNPVQVIYLQTKEDLISQKLLEKPKEEISRVENIEKMQPKKQEQTALYFNEVKNEEEEADKTRIDREVKPSLLLISSGDSLDTPSSPPVLPEKESYPEAKPQAFENREERLKERPMDKAAQPQQKKNSAPIPSHSPPLSQPAETSQGIPSTASERIPLSPLQQLPYKSASIPHIPEESFSKNANNAELQEQPADKDAFSHNTAEILKDKVSTQEDSYISLRENLVKNSGEEKEESLDAKRHANAAFSLDVSKTHLKEETGKVLKSESKTNTPQTKKGVSAEEAAEFQSRVAARINSVKNYPMQSLQNREQGKAVVSFVITPQGAAENPIIVESSGFHLLDEAGLKAVVSGAPYLPFVSDYNNSIRVRITINFVLD